MRRFIVVEASMAPTLRPGDGIIAVGWSRLRRGQLRVFPDPLGSTRWLVKRVGEVHGTGGWERFEARSDNPSHPGVIDSRRFGLVPRLGSLLVVFVHHSPTAPSS